MIPRADCFAAPAILLVLLIVLAISTPVVPVPGAGTPKGFLYFSYFLPQ
jgi:hypothetical protein